MGGFCLFKKNKFNVRNKGKRFDIIASNRT